jgi:AcrR family transcriptional regulator
LASRSFDRSELIARLANVFRHYGYEGASLARITAATGLGKGSLYHAFPGGKEEMALAVLRALDEATTAEILHHLGGDHPPLAAFGLMFEGMRRHFDEGRRICLIGAFALEGSHERFPRLISGHFNGWRDSMADCLVRGGLKPAHATRLALDILVAMEGGLVLARGLDDPSVFMEAIAHQEARIAALLAARQRTG